MKHIAYILLGLAVVAFGACGGNQFRDRLCHLDSLLVEHPDSVLQVLEGMHEEALTQAKGNRMYYELMRADAQNKAYVDFTTDSVMKIVAEYYDRHGSANEQMRAHYLLGCTYRDLNDVPMELQCFQEAVEKADTTSKDCDLYTLYAIYGQMADIYHSQYLPEEELKSLTQCEKVAILDGDSISAISAYELRTRAYFTMNMPDSVLTIAINARQRYLYLGATVKAARLLGPVISILIDRQEYDLAKKYMNIFEKESGYFDENGNINEKKVLYLHDKGRIALQNNQIEEAKKHFTKLIEANKKEAGYQGMIWIFQALNKPDSLARYSMLYASANDSCFINNNAQTIEQMTAMYNYGHQEKIAKEKTIAHKKAKETLMWLYIILISVLSAIAVTAIIIYNRNKAKDRQYQLLFKRFCDAKALVEELETKKEGMEKVGNREEAEKLGILQHELDASKMEIEQLSLKLNRTKQPNETFDFDAWLADFKKHDSVEKLWAIISKPKANSQSPDSMLYDLQKHFKTECHDYMQMLSSHLYDLNDLDRKVVMLDICGFSTKDIANILGKTPQQISNTHNRIKNKLFPSIESTYLLRKSLLAMLCDSLR